MCLLCDTKSYANRRTGTHTVDIQRVCIHTACIPDRERTRDRRETNCMRGARETDKEGASKTDVGPNSLSLDSITFNRLAGPMLPGAE